jgi:hypothetical protein
MSRVSMKSINRPGVAAQISTPSRNALTCGPFGAPPYTHALLILLLAPKMAASACICTASSRVGARTSAIGPSPGSRYGCALTWTTAGSKNDSVLPLPVSATATTSRPLSTVGHACDWIGVGVGNPAAWSSERT